MAEPSDQPVDDYTTWTRESLLERVRELEAQLKEKPSQPQPQPQDLPKPPPPLPSPSPPTAPPPTAAGKKEKGANPKKKNAQRKMDMSKYSTRLVALKLAYLGKNYNGFEHQPSATQPTIEGELWKALTKSCLISPGGSSPEEQIDFGPFEYSKCGRTDRGVSAFGQVISLRVRSNRPVQPVQDKDKEENTQDQDTTTVMIDNKHGGEKKNDGNGMIITPEINKPAWDPVADEIQYAKVLNRLLPPDIRILAWAPALPANFSARFSCRERQYRYYFTQPAFLPIPSSSDALPTGATTIKNGWLDIDAMRAAAKLFEGVYDFRNFCKIDPTKQLTNFTRRIFESDIVEVDGASTALPYLDQTDLKPVGLSQAVYPKVYYFHVRGSAFLWHQIRHMVTVLFLVGQGLEKPEIVSELLDVTKCPRKPNYVMADEVPLVLWDCIFPQLSEDVAAAASAGEGLTIDEDAHNPEVEVNNNLVDAMDWAWVVEPGSHTGLVAQLWEFWREKKMDELLASRLLDCISTRVDPGSQHVPGKTARNGPASQRIFEGGNAGRSMGTYVPMRKRPVQASVDEINDKWAQSKGFASAEELTRTKHWRSAIKAAKASAGGGGGGGGGGRNP
ncbi:pseudouridine synthase [Echria macrotheca]|uniref:Pseudouridine synthase n=1 Tax=Echria macrotheca TaxID=438768 RepID=A0AAJ0FHS7_9PEZI|nr:pseudouridine synthase [Echria macrotheca]